MSINACVTLWHMEYIKVKDVSKRTEKFQFQVKCMSFPTLKQNKASKEQFEKLALQRLTLDFKSNEKGDKNDNTIFPWNSNVQLEQEVYCLQHIECCYLMHLRHVFLYQLYVYTERKETVFFVQDIWSHFLW